MIVHHRVRGGIRAAGGAYVIPIGTAFARNTMGIMSAGPPLPPEARLPALRHNSNCQAVRRRQYCLLCISDPDPAKNKSQTPASFNSLRIFLFMLASSPLRHLQRDSITHQSPQYAVSSFQSFGAGRIDWPSPRQSARQSHAAIPLMSARIATSLQRTAASTRCNGAPMAPSATVVE
jgi:hypothetical protein